MRDEQSWETARINMVNNQLFTNKLTDDQIARAFLSVPREEFVPKLLRSVAYVDEGIDLDNNRILMEPAAFARLIQAAEIVSTDIVLDIACANGYSSAVLAQLAATVVGLETDEDIVAAAEVKLATLGIDNVAVVQGDLAAGYEEQGPYDCIFVNGAVEVVPDAYISQLADGGRMAVVERKGQLSQAILYSNRDGLISRRELFDAMVPVFPGFELANRFRF